MVPREEDFASIQSVLDTKKVIVPCGELVPLRDEATRKQCTLNYNEYIVYNVNQILMRYALHIKFDFQ